MNNKERLIIVRGGGDIASGTIYALCRCGFPVLSLEVPAPSAIRRRVAFSEAVYDGTSRVEDVSCELADSIEKAFEIMENGLAAVMVDPMCRVLEKVKPWALIDGILAKKNLGTSRDMAEKTIALGPGFTAGRDVDIVIETMRGHDLGRIIEAGEARANTGVPGVIAGFGKERVIHAEHTGIISLKAEIGDIVEKDREIAVIKTEKGEFPIHATLTGVLRGIIRPGYHVAKGLKIADIDPRESERENCFTISDKARCIAGSVLSGLFYLDGRGKRK
ncbi:MAG: selenium-dependent molybdenum cofactor biosynthesis protein YqeB [Bacillota bacterium]|nr:selenium-dependent molybdenum cofactor biosynthesis protein YqeB [Bacillota bacterium]